LNLVELFKDNILTYSNATLANVMQKQDGSSCGHFTIAYAIDIAFELNSQ
jgi:hypothetical protein